MLLVVELSTKEILLYLSSNLDFRGQKSHGPRTFTSTNLPCDNNNAKINSYTIKKLNRKIKSKQIGEELC